MLKVTPSTTRSNLYTWSFSTARCGLKNCSDLSPSHALRGFGDLHKDTITWQSAFNEHNTTGLFMAEPKSASDDPFNLQFDLWLRLQLNLWLRLRWNLLRLLGGHILHPPTVGRSDT
jgi:hypothetical protein